MQITRKDNNKQCALIVDFGEGPARIAGVIKVYNDSLFLLHGRKELRQGSSSELTSVYSDYPYYYHIGIDGERLLNLKGFIDISIISSVKILFKKDPSGALFRKIYKTDGELIFLGSIQKDPESCEKPSAVITVLDHTFLKSKGWSTYEKEPSAEQRLGAGKNPKVV